MGTLYHFFRDMPQRSLLQLHLLHLLQLQMWWKRKIEKKRHRLQMWWKRKIKNKRDRLQIWWKRKIKNKRNRLMISIIFLMIQV